MKNQSPVASRRSPVFPGQRSANDEQQNAHGESQIANRDLLPTGIPSLDTLLAGGLPRGRISEISGTVSAGRTSLLLSILAGAGRRSEALAYVDAFDMLDPSFLARGGVDADRLLWIRCRNRSLKERIDQSVKAADIVARAGGFGILVLDLAAPGISLPAVATSAWFRLQRIIRGTRTALLVLSPCSKTAGATSVRLALQRTQSKWGPPSLRQTPNDDRRPPTDEPRTTTRKQPLLEGIDSRAILAGGAHHGRITLHCRL